MFFLTCATVGLLTSVAFSAPAAPKSDDGCIRENRKLAIGEKMVIGEAVYECKQDASGSPTFGVWGCAAQDGSQHAGGESFDAGQYWYTCENKGGVVTLTLSGCVNDNVRFKDGDMFYRDNIVFQCQAQQGGGNLKVVGCMQEDTATGRKIERRVGCTWTEGTMPYLVTMTCTPNQETKTAVPTVVRCNYKMPEGTIYSINTGCYRLFDKVAVGCLKDPNTGKVTAVPIQVNDKGEAQSVPAGLTFC